jgi:biotin synthase
MPFSRAEMEQFREAGVERIGIPLDAATEELFDRIKGRVAGGPYRWGDHMRALRDAVEVFGRGRVSTHLMVGLGEVDRDLLGMVQVVMGMGVYPALFAFTPIAGSKLERTPQPSLRRYHRIQLAHSLITKGVITVDRMSFDSDGGLTSFGVDDETLRDIAGSGLPFVTSGCPGCNRPYYNERAGGKLYNYPARPRPEETARILEDILGEG